MVVDVRREFIAAVIIYSVFAYPFVTTLVYVGWRVLKNKVSSASDDYLSSMRKRHPVVWLLVLSGTLINDSNYDSQLARLIAGTLCAFFCLVLAAHTFTSFDPMFFGYNIEIPILSFMLNTVYFIYLYVIYRNTIENYNHCINRK